MAPRIRIIFPMMQACVDEMSTCFPNDVTCKSGIKIKKDLEKEENVDDSLINLTLVPPKLAPNEIDQHPGLIREFLDIGFTKLSYPFLDVGSLYLDDMKSWISHIFGIPCHDQVILSVCGNDLVTIDDILLNSWNAMPRLYWFAVFIDTSADHKALKPFECSESAHVELQKVQSIPIVLKCLNGDVNFHFKCSIKKNERIEEVMEQKFQIPRNRLFIIWNNQHQDIVAKQTKRVWLENLHALKTEWRRTNLNNKSVDQNYFHDAPPSSQTPLEFHIAVIVDKDAELELLENIRELGIWAIPLNRSVLIEYGGKTFCEFSYSVLNMFGCPGNQQLNIVSAY